MKSRLEECDHLIGVFSPDYIEAEYSESELLAAYWNDSNGQDGFLVPVVIRPCELPKLVGHLKGLDLTDCDKNEARLKLEEFITPPTAPEFEPDFDGIPGDGHATKLEPPTEPEPHFEPQATVSDPHCFEIHRLPTPIPWTSSAENPKRHCSPANGQNARSATLSRWSPRAARVSRFWCRAGWRS